MKNLKQNILKALEACDGLPIPEVSLHAAVQILARPHQPTQSDVQAAMRTLENEQFIAGVSDSIIGTSWTLTPKGVHKTRQF
jgi:hypothetical protein